jgi:hypothetical protein
LAVRVTVDPDAVAVTKEFTFPLTALASAVARLAAVLP